MKKTRIKLLMSVILLGFAFHSSYGQGARYTGTYTKSNPIRYTGKSNFVIEGVEISSTNEDCIALYNCENVIIRNSKLGPSISKRGVYLYGCKNITIEDCTFENVQLGLIASTSQGVKFEHNDVKNVVGMLNGGFEIGSMVQFIQVSGSGNSVSYNVCENIAGQSAPEDIINMFASHGTEKSPIVIKGNWIRGGGPSKTGGGINIGDYGGSYQIAEDNILVDVGQYGIGISGGKNMTLKNNKVYGKRQSFTNVGMVVTNWYEKEAGASSNIVSENNQINYTHADGYLNNWWIYERNFTVGGKSTNVYKSDLSASILPAKILGNGRGSGGSSNNNNTGNESETPEVEPDIPSGGGGSTTPDVEDNSQGSDTDKDADKDTGDDNDNGTDDEVNKPTSPGNQLTNVTIYLDWFNRICVNSRGRVYRGSTVTVSNAAGDRIHTQSLTGFHTVLRSRFKKGTYFVTVKIGNRSQTKELTIK